MLRHWELRDRYGAKRTKFSRKETMRKMMKDRRLWLESRILESKGFLCRADPGETRCLRCQWMKQRTVTIGAEESNELLDWGVWWLIHVTIKDAWDDDRTRGKDEEFEAGIKCIHEYDGMVGRSQWWEGVEDIQWLQLQSKKEFYNLLGE